MQVVYIYMKDYLGLKEKEYNFHENYKFYFNKKLKELKIEETNIQIPKNFFGETIVGINGIIGENGVGKTRILDFLYKQLNNNNRKRKFHKNEIDNINKKFLKKPEDIEYILILEDKNRFHIKCNLLDEKNNQQMDQSTAFYYSNIFDYDGGLIRRNICGNNTNNLSISDEMLKFSYNFTSLNMPIKNIKQKFQNEIEKYCFAEKKDNELVEIINKYWDIYEKTNLINIVKRNNDKKQIKFLKDLNDKYYKFFEILRNEINIPQTIKFGLIYPAYKNLENKLEPSNKILDDLEIGLDEGLEKKKVGEKEFLKQFEVHLMLLLGIDNLEKNESNKIVQLNFQDILEELKKILKKSRLIDRNKLIFEININDSNQIIDLIEKTSKRLEELKKDNYCSRDSRRNDIKDIFEYAWGLSMSSGEKALLRLFSLLHEVLEKNQQINKVILLVDELDATFHPEWQRKALDLLIKYLNNYSRYIKSNLTSQLIISSHSPFLIADLPKEKIIVLNSEGNQKNNEKLSAFGSNILDIYKENFFLTSTFGEFAKGKITNVIELLSKGESEYIKLSEDKKNEIKFIINSVGEPLIKNKLERMYFELEKEDPVQKIKKLMKEKGVTLEELKKGDI